MHSQSHCFDQHVYVFFLYLGAKCSRILAYFLNILLFIDFWRYLIQKRCPKSTKNEAKIDPSASQGGVWLPGSIWLAVDKHFLRFLMPNGSQNDLKIYQSSPRWCPGSAKCRTFPQTVALGASFGRLGPQSTYCFASVLNSFSSFPKNWGGEGVGSTISKITTPLSITSFFSTKTSDWHGAALLCNLDIRN